MRFACVLRFFFFWSSVIIFLKKKKKLNKFVLKTWISRRVSYFVGILSGTGDIFLPDCPQVFSLLSLRFRSISKSYKSPVQSGDPLLNSIDKTFQEIESFTLLH